MRQEIDQGLMNTFCELIHSRHLPWVAKEVTDNPDLFLKHRDFGLLEVREGNVVVGLRENGGLEASLNNHNQEVPTTLLFGNAYGRTLGVAILTPYADSRSVLTDRDRLVTITSNMSQLWISLVATGSVRSAVSVAEAIRKHELGPLPVDMFSDYLNNVYKAGVERFEIGGIPFDPDTPIPYKPLLP